MGYKLGSFNMYKFQAYRSDDKIKKDLDKIAEIIYTEKFDIIAMQEIFDEKPMNMILQRLGVSKWKGAWAKPNSRSSQAAEGYAFMWNTDRIMLAESVTASGKRTYYPRIYQQYKVDKKNGQKDLVREPFYGRFKPKYENYEIRIINTHIMFSNGGKDEYEDETLQLSDVAMRRNEFEILVKNILTKESTWRYGNNLTAYTILMGDYNLNLKRDWTKGPYLEEVVEINDGKYGFECILPGDDIEKQKLILELVGYIENRINEKKKLLNDLQAKMNNGFSNKDFEILFNLSFEYFTKEFLGRLLVEIKTHISEIFDMALFSNEETRLQEFCINHDIPEFKVSVNLKDRTFDECTGNRIYFSSDILGGEAFEKSERLSIARKMATRIDEKIADIITDMKKSKAYIYTRWNKLSKANFEDYFKDGKKKYYLGNRELRNQIIAVLVDKSFGFGNMDIVFTTDGVICDKAFIGFSESPKIVTYNQITGDNNKLEIGGDSYKNKEIKMFALYNLIQELSEMSASINPDYSGSDNAPAGYLQYTD